MQNIFNRTDSRTACNEIEGVGGINQYVISGTCKGAKKCFNPLLESIKGSLVGLRCKSHADCSLFIPT